MNLRKNITALATGLALTALIPSVHADEYDKKTTITVNETIMVPGATLTPGKYVMKLMNSSSNRHIVQIFDEDQKKLYTTILAFNNYRLVPKDKTELTYWETPAGTPPAMRAWFWPGDNFGQEFAYPKDQAELLARTNRVTVATYETTTVPLTVERAETLRVENIPQTSEADQKAAAEVALAPQPDTSRQNANEQAAIDQQNRSVVTEPQAPQPEPQILAQVTPPPPPPQTNVTPAAPPAPQTPEPTELPQTASPMPWMIAIGLAALVSAGSLTILRS
jgi:LPXTG-motif cell wall-anchored protein